jgi:predicted nucleic acid-binding Zn ribbon protein
MKKKCPFCAEEILEDAKKCRYCNEWLVEEKQSKRTNTGHNIKRKVIFIIGVLVLFLLLRNVLSGFVGSVMGYSNDVAGLERALTKQNQLLNDNNEVAARELYRNFLLPQDRTMTEDEYVKGFLENYDKNKNTKVIRHSIKVANSVGYVDRTLLTCSDKDCNSVIEKTRSYRKYYFENGQWRFQVMDVFCPRDNGYDMEPEFSRALSLITQRLFANNQDLSNLYQEIVKCVDIKYADINEEMSGADGVFRFIPDQSAERLSILVSPRYQAKDDLITATLLTHEVTHAIGYISGLYSGTPLDCYADEAFYEQNRFLTSLNAEEKQSVLGRMVLGGSSELVGISDALTRIPKMRGSTYKEKALNYVKSNPAYQKQCSNSENVEH